MGSRNREIAGNVNPILTTLATGYKNGRMIAPLVAPEVESLTESGTFYSFGKDGFKLYDTSRALGANAKQIVTGRDAKTYICKEHALEEPIDYKELEIAETYKAKKVLELKKTALATVESLLSIELEKAVADILFGAASYDTANKVTLSGNSCWSDKVNSDPIGDMLTGKKAARAKMGIKPNTLVLGNASFEALSVHPAITGKIKNSKNTYVTIEDLKQILGFENIFVGEAIYTNDDDTNTDIWADNASLIYLPVKGELAKRVPIHTVTIKQIGYPKVVEYSSKKTLDIEETRQYIVKNISTSNGYLIINTVA